VTVECRPLKGKRSFECVKFPYPYDILLMEHHPATQKVSHLKKPVEKCKIFSKKYHLAKNRYPDGKNSLPIINIC
jgi:hypothetical protein